VCPSEKPSKADVNPNVILITTKNLTIVRAQHAAPFNFPGAEITKTSLNTPKNSLQEIYNPEKSRLPVYIIVYTAIQITDKEFIEFKERMNDERKKIRNYIDPLRIDGLITHRMQLHLHRD
jgi:hypothetical protein